MQPPRPYHASSLVFSYFLHAARQGKTADSQEVTPTELEVEMHDDDDIYHDGDGMKEHGEEEVRTDDDCVDVETHDDVEVDDGHDNVKDHPTGTAVDTADTLPEVPDTQVLEKDFESDHEQKGAHRARARVVGTGSLEDYLF